METTYSYTRQNAIDDGMLTDVSGTSEAIEAGFKIPVCLTDSVFGLCQVPEGLEGEQDYKGRLWDTLYLAVFAFKRAEDKTLVPFEVSYQMAKPKRAEVVKLWLTFEGNEGFTVMLPEDY